MSELRNEHALRQWNVGQEQRVVQIHAGQIDFQKLRQILRQAGHFDIRAHVRNDAALRFDPGRCRLALEMNGQAQSDLLVLDHALQIDVHHRMSRRMHLHVFDNGFLGLAANINAHDRGVEFFALDHRQQILLIQNNGLRTQRTAIKNGRNLARVTQAAARTFALHLAGVRTEGK